MINCVLGYVAHNDDIETNTTLGKLQNKIKSTSRNTCLYFIVTAVSITLLKFIFVWFG